MVYFVLLIFVNTHTCLPHSLYVQGEHLVVGTVICEVSLLPSSGSYQHLVYFFFFFLILEKYWSALNYLYYRG